MPQPISGVEYAYAIALETTFNTGVADNAPMIQLACENFDIERNAIHQVPWRNSGKRIIDIGDVNAHTKGAIPACTIPILAYEETMDIFLYGNLQYVQEGATPTFAKTFDIPETAELPNFKANAGMFFTLSKKSPVASTSEKLATCIVNQIVMELSQSSGNGTGNLSMNIGLISTGGYSRTANPSGTWTKHNVTEFFNFNDLTLFQVGAADCIPVSFKMTLKNNAKPFDPVDGAGTWRDVGIGLPFELEFEVEVVNDANARTALAGIDTGAETVVQLSWGTPATDGYLDIQCRGSILPASKPTNENLATIKMNFIGCNDTANTQNALAISLYNSVDRGW